MTNFHAHIADLERHLRETPASLEWQTAMLQARQQEVSALGIVSSLDRIVELGDRIVKDHPSDAKAHISRASARGAVHDFAGAASELEQASKLGESAEDLEPARAGLAMALGNFDEAQAIYTKRIAAHATSIDLLMSGVCLGAMGKTQGADDAIQRAEDAYRDVSPFMIAWIYFERGNLWDSAGKLELAAAYYRIAVDRLPGYAHAAIHLSNFLPAAEATSLLQRLSTTADDPEVLSALALVGGDTLARAKAAYEGLMKKYPLAFADHAGWFYLNVANDPARAVDAAKTNVDNRKTPAAYELLIAAKLGAKMDADACAAADDASKLKYPSRGLRSRSAQAYERCGRSADARRIRG